MLTFKQKLMLFSDYIGPFGAQKFHVNFIGNRAVTTLVFLMLTEAPVFLGLTRSLLECRNFT